MEIIWLLGFIALVAVIFGVSMHDAFWGIVTFIIATIIVSIVVFFIKSGTIRLGKKINYYKSTAGKKAIKNKILDMLFGALIFVWLVGPFLVEIIAHTVFKEFAEKNDLLVFLMAISFFIIPPFTILIYYMGKKRTHK